MSITFTAKKRTEVLGGIGKETDIWTINNEDGIKKVSKETISKLEEKYNETKNKFSEVFDGIEINKEEIKYEKHK